MVVIASPALGLSKCPQCGYTIGCDDVSCPKCLKMFKTDYYYEKSAKSTLTVRYGTDSFIRHPQADNRTYKADRNSGADKTGQIGVWGGPCNLRYLINFDIAAEMKRLGIDFMKFKPKRAFLYLSALKNKSNIDVPIVVFPLTRPFHGGLDFFRERTVSPDDCTWYLSCDGIPWDTEGGDFNKEVKCKGIIKNGVRNIIDITKIIDYFYQQSKINQNWSAPGIIIMSDPDSKLISGFVTVYSLEANDYTLRPELFIE